MKPSVRRLVEHWDDERALGNSLIVTLDPGRAFAPAADEAIAEHVQGFDKVKEAERAIRASKACLCARCRPIK